MNREWHLPDLDLARPSLPLIMASSGCRVFRLPALACVRVVLDVYQQCPFFRSDACVCIWPALYSTSRSI